MRRFLPLFLLAAFAPAEDKKAPAIDIGALLRKSEDFAAQCKKFRITWSEGEVRTEGEIAYRGGGPCEFLVAIFPAKAHETIVLLDDGPIEGDGPRPRGTLKGMAQTINNAFLAAGFSKGRAFSWDETTGETFAPKGQTVHVYAEWVDPETKKTKRANMGDWLWNFKTVHTMEPQFVYTGSILIEHDGKNYFGAELDGLIVAVLNSGTAVVDSTEDGSLDNGAYEAIPIRIPPAGTRVQVVISKKELPAETYKPLKLNEELKKARAAYLEKRKANKTEKSAYRPPDARTREDADKEEEKKEEK
ncbi:MAG: YdjY domain-containing protein [Planctomycetota bacterium]